MVESLTDRNRNQTVQIPIPFRYSMIRSVKSSLRRCDDEINAQQSARFNDPRQCNKLLFMLIYCRCSRHKMNKEVGSGRWTSLFPTSARMDEESVYVIYGYSEFRHFQARIRIFPKFIDRRVDK